MHRRLQEITARYKLGTARYHDVRSSAAHLNTIVLEMSDKNDTVLRSGLGCSLSNLSFILCVGTACVAVIFGATYLGGCNSRFLGVTSIIYPNAI